MKFFFILVVFLTIQITVFSQTTARDRTMLSKDVVPQVQFEAKALSTSATVLDNVFLDQKGSDVFLDDIGSEVYSSDFATGQMWEMGGQMSYYIDYEPFSRSIVSFSCERWGVEGDVNYDSVRKIGRLKVARYEKGRAINTANGNLSYAFVYDTIDFNPDEATGVVSPIDVNEWWFPTITVTNPAKSTNLSDIKFAFSAQTDLILPNQTESNPRYNTISIINGDWFTDNDKIQNFKNGVSKTNIDGPYIPVGNYRFNVALKAYTAYLGIDKKPYAMFFGILHHRTSPTSNPYKFGLVAVSLEDIPDEGRNNLDNNLKKCQVLPDKIENIFARTEIIPKDTTWDAVASYSLDYDNNGNLYLGFMEGIDRQPVTAYGDKFRVLKMPTIVKVMPDFSTRSNVDIITETNYTVETAPLSLLQDYINNYTGEFSTIGPVKGMCDTVQNNTVPTIEHRALPTTGNLAFLTSDSGCHFITYLAFCIKDTNNTQVGVDPYVYEFVEFYKPYNGDWQIKKVADFDYISYVGSWANDWGAFMVSTTDNQLHYTGSNGRMIGNALFINPDLQISKTADNKYLIAKFVMTGPNDQVKLSDSIHFLSGSDAEPPVDTDTMLVPSLYLSYREIGASNSTWSTPIRASHLNYPEAPADFDPTRDTISFFGTYMPRIVPSVDEVIVSYSYASKGSNSYDVIKEHVPDAIAQYRSLPGYRYSGFIVPSAKTGTGYITGIEEGEPAINDNLAPAFPNPATNTVNFKFSLLKPSNTKLTISNSLGQEVAVVLNQFCNANEYSINYNVTTLPVGTYYFTLTSNNGIRQTKMFTIAR